MNYQKTIARNIERKKAPKSSKIRKSGSKVKRQEITDFFLTGFLDEGVQFVWVRYLWKQKNFHYSENNGWKSRLLTTLYRGMLKLVVDYIVFRRLLCWGVVIRDREQIKKQSLWKDESAHPFTGSGLSCKFLYRIKLIICR